MSRKHGHLWIIEYQGLCERGGGRRRVVATDLTDEAMPFALSARRFSCPTRARWARAGVAAAMSKIEVDTARPPLLPHELRLTAIARLWPEFAERADKESWPAARFLSGLAELEIAERGR